MNVIKYLRLYHATLAITALLAYITGEVGIIYAWLGYGVALIIVMRLLWAISGESQLGLSKFYPSFEGMKINNALTHPAISRTLLAGIALSVIAVTITGILIDQGKSIGLADIQMMPPAFADDDGEYGEYGEREDGFLSESHEFLANVMLLFVGMHVTYLILFKRPLALFMLFVPKQDKK